MKRDHHHHWAKEKPKQANIKRDDEQDARATISEIRMITRGPVTRGSFKSFQRAYRRQVKRIHAGHPMMKCRRTRVEDILFSEHDARRVKQPHDDLLVIMLAIKGYNTFQVLIYNGSLVDIMYMTAFKQMRLDLKRLRPFESPLFSVSKDQVYPNGIISLSVTTKPILPK